MKNKDDILQVKKTIAQTISDNILNDRASTLSNEAFTYDMHSYLSIKYWYNMSKVWAVDGLITTEASKNFGVEKLGTYFFDFYQTINKDNPSTYVPVTWKQADYYSNQMTNLGYDAEDIDLFTEYLLRHTQKPDCTDSYDSSVDNLKFYNSINKDCEDLDLPAKPMDVIDYMCNCLDQEQIDYLADYIKTYPI